MPRGPAIFRQSDLARALRAVKKAGVDMAVQILPDGSILIIPAPEPPVKGRRRTPGEREREIVL